MNIIIWIIIMITHVIVKSCRYIHNIYPTCTILVPNVFDSGTSGILHSMRCSDHFPIFTFRSISKTVAFEAIRKKGTFLGLEKS